MNGTGRSLILFSAILTIVFFISPACANARHRHRRIVPRARALPRISNTNDTDLPIHDGMLGLVPESFDEEDGTNAGFYPDPKKDSIKEFLDVCKNAKTCEECPATFKNSAKLRQSDPNVTRYTKCDALSLLNYNKLRLAQEHVRVKAEFLRNYVVAIVYIVLYVICIAIGIYLIVVDHFRIKTLWDKFAKNPAKGMRSARYQRMEFTFSYDDPGANPEDLTGYEDWVVYDSDEDSQSKHHYRLSTQTLGDKISRKLQAERKRKEAAQGGAKHWPWEVPGYDFSKVRFRTRGDDDAAGESSNI